ncbi:MAG: urea carboxylase-associated family protein [Kiloniellales bacterium]|nr:urea carboxylase-associated family protein [Kiloniellales bacterium]
MSTVTVPAREGRAFEVARGGRFRIVTPEGQQAADFFAFNARAVGEWLSANHTWIRNRRIKLEAGDEFQSRYRRSMLRLTEDGAAGVHDLMIPACDQIRYEQLGHEGPHASCSENLANAMRRLGHAIDVVPQPVNFFTHTVVEADGAFTSPPNPVPAGAYVELEALMDTICVVSACPFDLNLDGWTINSPERGPTALEVTLLGG